MPYGRGVRASRPSFTGEQLLELRRRVLERETHLPCPRCHVGSVMYERFPARWPASGRPAANPPVAYRFECLSCDADGQVG